MTFNFRNVYLNEAATVVGPYENDGPLGKYFDKCYKDLYFGTKSWEKAEVKILNESMGLSLNKNALSNSDVDLVISGDLLNQVSASCYAVNDIKRPFFGIYGACSTNVEALIMGASLISGKFIDRCMCSVSSHNMSSEKQFRNPTEYGAPKPKTATFTSTGGASAIISNTKSSIKVESGTIGKVVDLAQTNPLDMGAVMAGAAADTINTHLKDTGRDASYYDLIVTGDLGLYGKEILKDFMLSEYNIDLRKNYNDCGVILYDLKKQQEIMAGGSGPVCSALVLYTYIVNEMKKKNLKRVLMVATGALFNPNFVFQKENILSIAHAVSLEAI